MFTSENQDIIMRLLLNVVFLEISISFISAMLY